MALPLPEPYITVEEYLALERAAAYKSEYLDGVIYAMSGASKKHNLIAANLIRRLGNQLDDSPCLVMGGDMRVKVKVTGLYTYPDVVIVCAEPQLEDDHLDTLLNPTVLIEVLSPSTAAYDRGKKFAHYKRLATLTDYVLIAQDRMYVEHYGRRRTQWQLTKLAGPDAVLRLVAIGVAIPLREIYQKVGLTA